MPETNQQCSVDTITHSTGGRGTELNTGSQVALQKHHVIMAACAELWTMQYPEFKT